MDGYKITSAFCRCCTRQCQGVIVDQSVLLDLDFNLVACFFLFLAGMRGDFLSVYYIFHMKMKINWFLWTFNTISVKFLYSKNEKTVSTSMVNGEGH